MNPGDFDDNDDDGDDATDGDDSFELVFFCSWMMNRKKPQL